MLKKNGTIKINVTNKDIRNGIPGDECKCPIALAVKRVMPRGAKVVVNSETIEYSHNERGMKWELTTHGQHFVNRFDEDQKVKPFSFHLPVL